ncbi:EamA family transporter [Gordonia phthalatica]|uniref:Membrane protein n=1 Tax=Gordonia phthalatica TaxID=1136941 RepID=A0A0N9MRA1_9ACTN|nr:EamA family transporter [Gordonia phthalatica]ALG85477.1 membrane protein [Gordonia phthalatica]
MPMRHRLLAITVAAFWGINFIAIHYSLETFPPFLCAALRFGLIAIPTVLLVPRPNVEWRWLVGFGIGFGFLQFAFLYWGMAAGMPAGLASLVLQASAPFTVVLGAVFLRERLTPVRFAGIAIAVIGLAVVGWEQSENAAILPFLLTLAGALGWAIGNVCNRQARAADPLRLTLWMSVIPPVPLLIVSLVVERPARIEAALREGASLDGLPATLGLLYTIVIATLAGSGIWTWLMTRHPAGVVAPFSMLVPVFGMSAAWIVLGQAVTPIEAVGGVLVVGGVLLGSAVRKSRRAGVDVTPPAVAQDDGTALAATTSIRGMHEVDDRSPAVPRGVDACGTVGHLR